MGEGYITRRGAGSNGKFIRVFAVHNEADLPISARSNVVVIISNIAVNEVTISNTMPESAVLGDVWIYSDKGKTLVISKPNQTVEIYISRVSQYNGSEWVDVASYSYENGEPSSVKNRTYILKNGEQIIPMTLSHCEQSGGYLYISDGDGSPAGYCLTTEPFDLTNKTTLCASGYNVDHAYQANVNLQIYGTWIDNSMGSAQFSETEGIVSIDISNLSGSYYIGCYGAGYGYNDNKYSAKAYISDIWLE